MRADAQADPDARSNTALHKDLRWNRRLVWLPDLNQDKGNHEHSGEHKTENHTPFAPLEAVSLMMSGKLDEQDQNNSLDT